MFDSASHSDYQTSNQSVSPSVSHSDVNIISKYFWLSVCHLSTFKSDVFDAVTVVDIAIHVMPTLIVIIPLDHISVPVTLVILKRVSKHAKVSKNR